MSFTQSVPAEYGWVLLALLFTIFTHHFYMSFNVAKARKRFNVRYPALYAAEGALNATEFNCVQRGHQNSLENLPQFLALLLTVGVRYPISAAIAGAIYNVGKILYFMGYSTGNPAARMRGGISYIGLLPLYGAAGRWAVELLSAAK